MQTGADIANAPFARFRLDSAGVVVEANSTFDDLIGLTAGTSAVGRPLVDFVVAADVEDLAAALADGEGGRGLEAWLRRADGSVTRVAVGAQGCDAGGCDGVMLDLGRDRAAGGPILRSIQASAIGITLVGPDQRPLWVNQALLDMLGVDEREFLAEAPWSIMRPEDVDDARLRMRAMVAGDLDHYEVERRMRRKDGSELWVLVNASAVRDDQGRFEASLTHFVDVTARRQSEEALQRSQSQNRALLEAIPDMMFRIDADGYIRWWRPARNFPAAMDPEEFLGAHITDVHPEMADTWLDVFARVIVTGESELVEYDLGPRGQAGSFEAQVASIRGEEVLVAIRDVTERRRLQRHLEELVQAKDEMVATVSHELRTPLTSVVGFAEELRDRWDELTPEDARQMVELITDQSREMAELVDDLLVAARGDIGMLPLHPREVDVGHELSGVLGVWRGPQVNVAEPDGAVVATADPVRLRQILRNLLRNAERYGRGPIEVELARGVEGARVRVRDRGPGLPEEEWEMIFDPYYRAHDPGDQPGTFGLGLTISRMLAWLMDGDLVYRVEDGQSTFELMLPA